MKIPAIYPKGYLRRKWYPESLDPAWMGADPEFIRSWKQAETNAVVQLRAMGYTDAESAPVGKRSIDVVSSRMVGQVKRESSTINCGPLLCLYADGHKDGREMWFFSASEYSAPAVEFADENGILLFMYDASGELESVNLAAEKKLHDYLVRKEARLRKMQKHRQAFLTRSGVWLPGDPTLQGIAKSLARTIAELEEYERQMKTVAAVDVSSPAA